VIGRGGGETLEKENGGKSDWNKPDITSMPKCLRACSFIMRDIATAWHGVVHSVVMSWLGPQGNLGTRENLFPGARILIHFKVTTEKIAYEKVNFSNGILKQPDFSLPAVCHCGQETYYLATLD
jgi:hypothetical protein